MQRLNVYALLAGALLTLAACGSEKPELVMNKVRPGMTLDEVTTSIGPADEQIGSRDGAQCAQYAIGESVTVPFAVYFDSRHRVVQTERRACDRTRLGAIDSNGPGRG